MLNDTLVIGLGHRARQGKDYVSEHLKNTLPYPVHILHFADELYRQVKNPRRISPLIIQMNGHYLLLTDDRRNDTLRLTFEQVPLLHKIMTERKIKIYEGMEEKDGEMLQFWGTDFRREFFGQDYWVKQLTSVLMPIALKDGKKVILIPDTRFVNEIRCVKELEGFYVEVQRFNADGTRFYAPDRDRDHPSEKELDSYTKLYDYTIQCESGKVDLLKEKATNIFQDIANEVSF